MRKDQVQEQIEEWIQAFANNVTTDPMGDYIRFQEGARELVRRLHEANDEEEG